MALRVLLADESVTIKKVIQLALQDFAVEVKAVPVGLDVLEVSKTFQPDLVFADILLQKRSGYDACADLKRDPETAAIPVVLMWSSFMELDQNQAESCGADGRLEKPFEVETLRKLVLELVPRTRSQRLAHFLDFPATIAAPLKTELATKSAMPKTGTRRPAEDPNGVPTEVTPVLETLTARKPTGKTLAGAPPAISLGGSVAAESGLETIAQAPTSPSVSPSVSPPKATPNVTPTLGALPDLQLDNTPPIIQAAAPEKSNWNMESFATIPHPELALEPNTEPTTEPVLEIEHPGLELADVTPDLTPETPNEDSDESFRPIQLPPLETRATQAQEPRAQVQPDDDAAEDAAEDDKWTSRSLAKYRLAPLQADESLAADEDMPDFSGADVDDLAVREPEESPGLEAPPTPARPQQPAPMQELNEVLDIEEPPPTERISVRSPSVADQTEILPQRTSSGQSSGQTRSRFEAPDLTNQDEELSEFTLSEDDLGNTSNLEIEPVSPVDRSRPTIVRELLRDPDFTLSGEATVRQNSPSQNTAVRGDGGAFDLGSAGRPNRERDSGEPATGTVESNISEEHLEALIQAQVEPALEKVIERVLAKILPTLAEKIIKRELERLLEDTNT